MLVHISLASEARIQLEKDIQLNLIIGSRIYRENIAQYFKIDSCVFVERMFSSAAQALRQFNETWSGVIVLDSHLDNLLPAIQQIKQSQPELKIVLLVLDFESVDLSDCVAAGVEGLITNNDSIEDLKNCIVAVHSGHVCYPAEVARSLVDGQPHPHAFVVKGGMLEVNLTSRQTKVLQLIENGFSNKEIARKLNIQPATVKNHVHQILERLNVKSRCEAASVYRRVANHVSLYG